MFKISNKNIYHNRGDTGAINLNTYNFDFYAASGSIVEAVFYLRRTKEDTSSVLNKTFDENNIVELEHSDTSELRCGCYWYDIKALVEFDGNTEYITFGPYRYYLLPEGMGIIDFINNNDNYDEDDDSGSGGGGGGGGGDDEPTDLTPIYKLINRNCIFPDNLSHMINGIIWTVNEDGTISANGTATPTDSSFFCTALALPKGEYIVNGCPEGGSSSTYDVYVYRGNGDNTGFITTAIARDYGTEGEVNKFTLDADNIIYYCCRVFNGYTARNLVWKPMIRSASNPSTDFMQYVPSAKELYPLLKEGGKHIEPANDATMSELCDVAASYYRFYNFATATAARASSKFTYGGTLRRLWDGDDPQKDANNKYQMSCSVYVGALLYGISYENSVYNYPSRHENTLSPSAYQSTDLYDDFCETFSRGGLSYYASQHMAKYCVEHGYSYIPKDDMSDVQPGDILFFNFNYNDRPYYYHVSHSETVAYRINDRKLAVWECGSSRGPVLWERTIADMKKWLILVARLPRPNNRSISYRNLVRATEIDTTETTTTELLKTFHLTETLSAWKQYTLIAHITAGDITKCYPKVMDTGESEYEQFHTYTLSYSGATKKPANDIYILPFIPQFDVSILRLMMQNDSEQTISNTVDYVCVVEGLVTNCPSLEWIKGVSMPNADAVAKSGGTMTGDLTLADGGTALSSKKVQCGSVELTAASNDYAEQTVTFASQFSTSPKVVVSFASSSTVETVNLSLTLYATNISSTGCKIRMFNGSTGEATRRIDYIAMG